MATTQTIAPPLLTPKTWDEVEQAFGTLQTYLANLNAEYQDLLVEVARFKQSAADNGIWKPVQPTFDATQFQATSGNWTVVDGGVEYFRWTRFGNTVIMAFHIVGTTSGTPVSVRIPLPLGIELVRASDMGELSTRDYFLVGYARINDVGTLRVGHITIEAGDNQVYIQRFDTVALGTGTVSVRGHFIFECRP